MAISGAQPKARIARAIWAYTLKTQNDLADDAGIHKDRLRAILARRNQKEASLDELIKLANAAKIPELFALYGFSAIEGDDGLIPPVEVPPAPRPLGELGRVLGDGRSKARDRPPARSPRAGGKRQGGGG